MPFQFTRLYIFSLNQIDCISVTMLQLYSCFQVTVIILVVSTLALFTLDVKWSDEIPSQNSIGKKVLFSHPFLQVTVLFLGSILCLGVFYIQKCFQQCNASSSIDDKKFSCKTILKFPIPLCFSMA